MLLSYFATQAGFKIAESMRRELALLLAADSACPLCADGTAGAYRLLRSAENLELYCALYQNRFVPRSFDLCAVCRCVFSAAQDVIPYPFGTLRLTCCSHALPVSASQSALISVLLNLICNSLLYGGAKSTVHLRVFKQGDRAVMIFSDNGPGIPLHRQHRALTPFETNSHLPGFGLGLPLAELFCRRSHGTFTLESQPGQGVRLALSLPIFTARHLTPAPDPTALLADRFSPIYTQLSPRCILPD